MIACGCGSSSLGAVAARAAAGRDRGARARAGRLRVARPRGSDRRARVDRLDADKPLLDRAVISTARPKLTSSTVVEALSALGLAGINQAFAKNPNAIAFPAPIARDGPVTAPRSTYPSGSPSATSLERRERLAAGLRRPTRLRLARRPAGDPPVTARDLVRRSGRHQGASSRRGRCSSAAASTCSSRSRSAPTRGAAPCRSSSCTATCSSAPSPATARR